MTHKTLRISKTFGIEGKKLLRPEDDYEALKDFNHLYEGAPTPAEQMQLEYDELLAADAGPGGTAGGPAGPGVQRQASSDAGDAGGLLLLRAAGGGPRRRTGAGGESPWTEEAGRAAWYLYDLATGEIAGRPGEDRGRDPLPARHAAALCDGEGDAVGGARPRWSGTSRTRT